MPKISFRIMPASRDSISYVQTGTARKPNRCAIHVRGLPDVKGFGGIGHSSMSDTVEPLEAST
ncbi:hypothetical protein GCM10009558_007620 [Virgisporangium aurantiacum]